MYRADEFKRVNHSNAYERNTDTCYELYSYDTFIAGLYFEPTDKKWYMKVNIAHVFTKPAFACTATTRRHFGLWLNRLYHRVNAFHRFDYCEIRDWYNYAMSTDQLDKSFYLNAGYELVFVYV